MSNVSVVQPKKLSVCHWNAWPQPVAQVVAPTVRRPRTDQFCTMRLVLKNFAGKRRNWMNVPLAYAAEARLTQGPTMMSSSQLWTTKPPGPNAMLGSLAMVGVE